MSKSDSTTININVNGDNANKTQGYGQVINCPVPWPPHYPFPFPFPFPTGPFDTYYKPNGVFNETDTEQVLFHGVKLAMNLEIKDGFDKEDMQQHIKEDVLPKIAEAKTLKDVNSAMEKVYEAYPAVQEFVYTTAKKYGEGNDGGSMAKKGIPKWLKFIFKVVIFILKLLLED